MELLSIIMLSFAVCFIAFVVGLVFFNVLVMMGNSEQSKVAEKSKALGLAAKVLNDKPKSKVLTNSYLETTPSHKTRVALRKKRKSK